LYASKGVVHSSVAAATVTLYARLPVLPLASVAVTVNALVAAVVGVPVTAPPLDKLNPAGNVPLVTAYVYGPVPPVAATVPVYAVPTVPSASVSSNSIL
jgi:hypothetical protein